MDFGHINQSCSIFHTNKCAPVYIQNNILVTVSFNTINFHSDSKTTFSPIVSQSQITAIATYPKEGLIAFSDSNTIHILQFPDLTPVGVAQCHAENDLDIVALAFSADGSFIASLGSLPTHTISIFDYRLSASNAILRDNPIQDPLLCSIENNGPASKIAFNPLDKRILFTCDPNMEYKDDEFDLDVDIGPSDGFCRGIRFFKISMLTSSFDMSQMYY